LLGRIHKVLNINKLAFVFLLVQLVDLLDSYTHPQRTVDVVNIFDDFIQLFILGIIHNL
jgi:hypothetical protein